MIAPRRVGDHGLGRDLDRDQHRPNVDGEGEVPVGWIDLEQRSHLQDPGVVDEDVQSAEVVDRLIDHGNGRLDVGQIDLVWPGFERCGGLGDPVDVDVEQGKLGTFAVERGGDLCSDAAGSAGDQRAPSGESALECPHRVGV